jgi:hypothetical protein
MKFFAVISGRNALAVYEEAMKETDGPEVEYEAWVCCYDSKGMPSLDHGQTHRRVLDKYCCPITVEEVKRRHPVLYAHLGTVRSDQVRPALLSPGREQLEMDGDLPAVQLDDPPVC